MLNSIDMNLGHRCKGHNGRGQHPFSIVSLECLKCEITSRHFQPGKGPGRGLLRDCENQLWNRWIVCSTATHSGGVPSRLNCSNSTCTRSPAQGHKQVTGCIRTVHIQWNQKLPGSALKLYVHCLTWPSGLRKFGATKVPFFDLMFVVEMKFWSQAAIKR